VADVKGAGDPVASAAARPGVSKRFGALTRAVWGPGRLRPGVGVVAGVALLAASVGALLPVRNGVDHAVPALVIVLPVVVAGALGGRRPAVVVGALAAAIMNILFLPPYNTFRIALRTDAVSLAAFLAVAVTVGALAAGLAERQRSAEERAEDVLRMQDLLRQQEEERLRHVEEGARLRLLEEVDQQRAALLRSVSHDLRTPLATIRAITSDLRSGTCYSTDETAELLDLVGEEAQRLDRLVANLLSLSRIEAGAWQPNRQPIDLPELVRHRVKRLTPLFSQVRVAVEMPDALPLVDGDYVQMEQVFTNLLENASRHAPPLSTVVVRARVRREGEVEVEVEDEGIGIPEHDRRRIFEPFRRGEGSTSSGIGLAICKGIVEAHGGAIEADRAAGGGALFRLTLPVWAAREGRRRG